MAAPDATVLIVLGAQISVLLVRDVLGQPGGGEVSRLPYAAIDDVVAQSQIQVIRLEVPSELRLNLGLGVNPAGNPVSTLML